MSIGERISESMKVLNLTFDDVSEMTFIAKTTLNRYRQNETEPKEGFIDKFCAVYGINPEWLKSGIGEMFSKGNIANINSYNELLDKVYSIPVFDIKASAGYGIENFDIRPEIKEKLFFDKKFFPHYNKDNIIGIYASGDSMEPIIYDGDPIFFAEGLIKGDDIYVINREGELYVKRIQFLMGGRKIRIISENSRYPQEEINLDTDTQLHFAIIGVVVSILRMR